MSDSSAAVALSCSLAAAVCWGAYILLTQRVGDGVDGIAGLAVSMPVAGLVATAVVGPSIVTALTPELILIGIGLAILLPVVPFILELFALRRLTTAAFGTLMSLEPAFAMILGLIVLAQVPGPLAILGIALVGVAGGGAARETTASEPRGISIHAATLSTSATVPPAAHRYPACEPRGLWPRPLVSSLIHVRSARESCRADR